LTTPAKLTSSSSSYMFRACSQVGTEWGPKIRCSSWW
jgi:hypothetical protein